MTGTHTHICTHTTRKTNKEEKGDKGKKTGELKAAREADNANRNPSHDLGLCWAEV